MSVVAGGKRWRLVPRSACPVCGAGGAATLLDLPYDGGVVADYLRAFYEGRVEPSWLAGERYVLALCGGCGLVYQRDVPDDATLGELYGSAAAADAAAVSAGRGLGVRRMYATDIELACRYFGRDPAGLRVMDFGAGTGLWLAMAAAFGCRTVAVEISAPAVGAARATGHSVLALDEIPPASVEFINSEQVFEHLIDPAGTLRRLRDVLVPGGVIRLSVPNGGDVVGRLDRLDWSAPKTDPSSPNVVAPLEHVNCFDHACLRSFGRETGLERFTYPLAVYLESGVRVRTLLGGIRQRVRPPRGTLIYFRRPL